MKKIIRLTETELTDLVRRIVKEQEEPKSETGSAVARYKVKIGDNLSKIAKELNTTVQKLMKDNPKIKNPNKLDVGQELVIVSESR